MFFLFQRKKKQYYKCVLALCKNNSNVKMEITLEDTCPRLDAKNVAIYDK